MIINNEDYITAYAHNDTMLVNNGKALKGQNRYDGQHGCRIRKTTLPDFATGRRPSIRCVTPPPQQLKC